MLAPADRAARLLALCDIYGKHHVKALSELVREGLDSATQARELRELSNGKRSMMISNSPSQTDARV